MIGILGGTFDPPHNGHVALAEAALRELNLDELIVLLVARPGHRSCAEDAETRQRLAEAAFADLPGVRVLRDENAYTVDAFSTWKEPDEVLRWVRLAVGKRSGYPPPDLERYGDRVVPFELASPPISSSDVRRRIRGGEAIAELVPPRVAELIEERALYRSDGNRG